MISNTTTRNGLISLGDTVKVVRATFFNIDGAYVGMTGAVTRIDNYSTMETARDDVYVRFSGAEESVVFEVRDLEKVAVEFEVGTRVIVKSDFIGVPVLAGRSGLIVAFLHSSGLPLVQFEDWNEGHSGNGFADRMTSTERNKWYIHASRLVPVAGPDLPSISDQKSAQFNVGDRVKMVKWYEGRMFGGPGTVLGVSRPDHVKVKFDDAKGEGHGEDRACWNIPNTAEYLSAADPEPTSAFKGKHWILCLLDKDGKPLPADRPRIYATEQQARAVAYEMAEKHDDCVFAIYEMTAYSAEETITVDVLKAA